MTVENAKELIDFAIGRALAIGVVAGFLYAFVVIVLDMIEKRRKK